tara:strand:+ start:212 stop:697 length:486 start_codon:yes stop_codon:yes gene_type:complete
MRLGTKTKQVLRVGSKVGSVALAVGGLALGVKGQAQKHETRSNFQDLKAKQTPLGGAGVVKQAPEIAQAPRGTFKDAPRAQTIPKPSPAQSNVGGMIRAGVKGGVNVAMADTKIGKAKEGVKAVRKIRAVEGVAEGENIRKAIADAEKRSKKNKTKIRRFK